MESIQLSQDHREMTFENWGLIDYREGLDRQLAKVEEVARDPSRETIIFCSHPPVVTLGRATREGDLCGWAGETIEIGRGGRATYHGPSQLVVYPILDLNRRGRDLHKYLRALEESAVDVLRSFGIAANGRSLQLHDGDATAQEATGVWIGSRKIASIGIGVRKWISFHGLAMNIEHDPAAFFGMKPCGFTPSQMISLEEVLGAKPDRERIMERMRERLTSALGA